MSKYLNAAETYGNIVNPHQRRSLGNHTLYAAPPVPQRRKDNSDLSGVQSFEAVLKPLLEA